MRDRMRVPAVIALVALAAVLVATLVRTNPARADLEYHYEYILHYPTSPPAGWVFVNWILTASGCSGCSCGSNWQPGSATGLMEKPGDRQTVGRNQGPTSSPWGATWDGRDKCPNGEYAAGTWYHNAVFNVSWTFGGCTMNGRTITCHYYGSWDGSSEGGNFAESDVCCDGSTCGPPGNPGATPTPCYCPGDSWSYSTPSFSALTTRPPYPVVVGQDPNRVGATAIFQVSLGPATHIWYGPECPACPAHYETVPDSISGGAADVILTQESRNWIVNELGRRYYGAAPKHPDWRGVSLILSNCHYEGNTHVCTASAHVPAEDPGQYTVDVTIAAGLNGPRSLGPYRVGTFKVWMVDTTLWPR